LDDLAAYIAEQTNGIDLQQMADNIATAQSACETLTTLLSDVQANIVTLQSNILEAQADIADLATRVSNLEIEVAALQNP
jgi:peptidoglycan hydrolase CwlO-like protein